MAPKASPKAAQQQQQPATPQIPLRDDPYAPMIYVTELAGGGTQGDNYNLTFAALLYDHSEGMTKAYRKTNLRLVIPKVAVPAAVHFLQQLLAADAPVPAEGSRTLQ